MSELSIPLSLPAEGYNIPLRAAFTGMKNIPHIALTHSSISPKLVLYSDHLKGRVIRTFEKNYSDIERIEVFRSIGTTNICFIWQDSMFSFTANLRHKEQLAEVLRFLQGRMVPLADSARKVLEQTKPE